MWENLVVTLIGAAVGAVLTVAIASATFLINQKYRETRGLNLLVEELHHRRALAPIPVLAEVPEAQDSDDFARVSASVLSIKEAIRDTREVSRSTAAVRVPLSRMTSSCNRYLELAARHPKHYWYYLADLRAELAAEVDVIARANRRVVRLVPGGASL